MTFQLPHNFHIVLSSLFYRKHTRPSAEDAWKDCIFMEEKYQPLFFNEVNRYFQSGDGDGKVSSLRTKLKSYSEEIFGSESEWKGRLPLAELEQNGWN